MNLKGISPLIATVILVGFTILIGSIVLLTSTETINQETSNINELLEKPLVVRFNAQYGGNCSQAGSITCSSDVNPNDQACYNLLVENTEDFNVNYVIRTHSELGSDFCGPFEIEAFNSKFIDVIYDKSKVGEPSDTFEVTADIEAVDI